MERGGEESSKQKTPATACATTSSCCGATSGCIGAVAALFWLRGGSVLPSCITPRFVVCVPFRIPFTRPHNQRTLMDLHVASADSQLVDHGWHLRCDLRMRVPVATCFEVLLKYVCARLCHVCSTHQGTLAGAREVQRRIFFKLVTSRPRVVCNLC